jgi:hypothetical protein
MIDREKVMKGFGLGTDSGSGELSSADSGVRSYFRVKPFLFTNTVAQKTADHLRDLLCGCKRPVMRSRPFEK